MQCLLAINAWRQEKQISKPLSPELIIHMGQKNHDLSMLFMLSISSKNSEVDAKGEYRLYWTKIFALNWTKIDSLNWNIRFLNIATIGLPYPRNCW